MVSCVLINVLTFAQMKLGAALVTLRAISASDVFLNMLIEKPKIIFFLQESTGRSGGGNTARVTNALSNMITFQCWLPDKEYRSTLQAYVLRLCMESASPNKYEPLQRAPIERSCSRLHWESL